MFDDEMPPALPDGYICEPGTVPGWLNEEGLPTSCVGDDPMVEPEPEEDIPVELPLVEPLPEEVAEPVAPIVEAPAPVVEEVVVTSEPIPGVDVLAETGPESDVLLGAFFGVAILIAGIVAKIKSA